MHSFEYDPSKRVRQKLKNLAVQDIYSIFSDKELDDIVSYFILLFQLVKVTETKKKDKLDGSNHSTISEIEDAMKELSIGLNRRKFGHLIYQRQRNLKPLYFTPEEIKTYNGIVNLTVNHFEEAKKNANVARHNWFTSKFLLYKIFEHMQRNDVLSQLSRCHSIANYTQQEKIWAELWKIDRQISCV